MPTPKDYSGQFVELGLEKVRAELLMRRWEPDKLAAARLWVEKQDTQRWLAGRGSAPPKTKPKWLRKYGLYIIFAVGLTFVLGRMARNLF